MGIVAGAAFVLATGLWAPAGAAVTEATLEPGDGAVVSARSVPVQMSARSDSGNGLQYMRLEIYDTGGQGGISWCAPGPAPSCPSWAQGATSTHDGSYSWSVGSQRNGEYTLKLLVKEHGGALEQRTSTVKVNVPPQTPQWVSVTPSTAGGRASVSLKWRANAEPDMLQYKITRSTSGGQSTFFKVDAGNPAQQGCSMSGGKYTCTDAAFPETGYSGTYTYYLSATRSSPVSSAGVSSGQAERSTTVTEPAPSPTGRPGGGGSRPGGGSNGGGSSNGGYPTFGSGGNAAFPRTTLTPTPDPFAPEPGEFFEGEYENTLPYKQPVRTEVLGERVIAEGFAEESGGDPIDNRKTLLPVAGGLFTIIAAAHFRRILRDA